LLASTVGIGLAAILNLLYHDRSFLLMVAISMFGPLFTWMMIFITHLRFRRRYQQREGQNLGFRMWGYPYTSLSGCALMLAALITTLFIPVFRPTLLYGLPFLIVMTLIYSARRQPITKPASHD
jgi:L-asparagine transporter-like permease